MKYTNCIFINETHVQEEAYDTHVQEVNDTHVLKAYETHVQGLWISIGAVV